MLYLYHRVPENIQGSVLYPLNRLKETMPGVYKKEVQKYEGRESLLEIKIPLLDCLWNDVLHLTAVHPNEVKKALVEAGRSGDFQMRYFQIDPATLDLNKTVVYRYLQEGLEDITREDNFVFFDLSQVEELSRMPESTKNYYHEMIAQEKKPLLYHCIPHILYLGTLDISKAEIITV